MSIFIIIQQQQSKIKPSRHKKDHVGLDNNIAHLSIYWTQLKEVENKHGKYKKLLVIQDAYIIGAKTMHNYIK